MGNKVPNSLLKSLCVCICVCMYVCASVCVHQVERGMWNRATNTMMNVTENSFCGGGGSIFS